MGALYTIPYATVYRITPPVNRLWKLDSLSLLLQADADVGTRRVQVGYYGRSDTGVAVYHLAMTGTASTTSTVLMEYGIPYSKQETFFWCAPLPTYELQNPNSLAIYWDIFKGAADVLRATLIYHERDQL
jgi:hypothetical protein